MNEVSPTITTTTTYYGIDIPLHRFASANTWSRNNDYDYDPSQHGRVGENFAGSCHCNRMSNSCLRILNANKWCSGAQEPSSSLYFFEGQTGPEPQASYPPLLRHWVISLIREAQQAFSSLIFRSILMVGLAHLRSVCQAILPRPLRPLLSGWDVTGDKLFWYVRQVKKTIDESANKY